MRRSGAEATECISGQIMRGVKKPRECPAFGTRCTPEHPLGAPMVSSEGACAAYYRYRSREKASAGV
jgi:hydrogenase expression/formation protein HypD